MGRQRRPDVQARSALAKKASELAENARVSIRAVRHQGQKDLKADQDNKIVGESDARRDAKHVSLCALADKHCAFEGPFLLPNAEEQRVELDSSRLCSYKTPQRRGRTKWTLSSTRQKGSYWTNSHTKPPYGASERQDKFRKPLSCKSAQSRHSLQASCSDTVLCSIIASGDSGQRASRGHALR